MPGSRAAMEQSNYTSHYSTWFKHQNNPLGDKQVSAVFDEGQKWEPLKLWEGGSSVHPHHRLQRATALCTWRQRHWCVLYSRKRFLINLRGASLNVTWQLKQRMLIQGFTHCCEVANIAELGFTRWMLASFLCFLMPIHCCDCFYPFLLRLMCAEILI